MPFLSCHVDRTHHNRTLFRYDGQYVIGGELTINEFQRARTQAQREQRECEIRSAARRLLAQTDIDDVTLRAIAVEAGLAPSNVLRHVGSREELLLNLMDEEYGAWLAELNALVAVPHGAVDTRTAASTIADTLARRPLLQCLIEVSPQLLRRLPAAHVQSREQGRRNGDGLADAVEAALGTRLPADDRVYLVAGLHAVVSAAAAWSRQGVFPVSASDAIRDLVQIQLDGLLARAGSK